MGKLIISISNKHTDQEILCKELNMDKIGSKSIYGTIVKMLTIISENERRDIEININFPQSTIQFRKIHNGPKYISIPEYVIPLIIEDIIYLTNKNYKININMPEILDE